MSIGEDHSLTGELVDIRGFDLSVFRIETLNISVSQIVTHDEDDVGQIASWANPREDCYGKEPEKIFISEKLHAREITS